MKKVLREVGGLFTANLLHHLFHAALRIFFNTKSNGNRDASLALYNTAIWSYSAMFFCGKPRKEIKSEASSSERILSRKMTLFLMTSNFA